MTRITCRAASIALLLALVPAAGLAQRTSLPEIDSLVRSGHYADARRALGEWTAASDAGDASPSMRDADRAHVLMLRARLSPDAQNARRHYLSVALGYPSTAMAATALLRLGQGLLASGDAERAVTYLLRLLRDHPGSAHRGAGTLWLARAQVASGAAAAACRTARDGLDGPVAGSIQSRLVDLRDVHCGASAAGRPGVAPEPGDRQAVASDAAVSPSDATGRFAVQSGAFRYDEGAIDLVGRLGDAGHVARMVYVPGSELLRVRVGRFQTLGAAQGVARQLQDDGFAAVVVANADEETANR